MKTSQDSPRRTLLENGIWVATEFLSHVRSVDLGVWLDTGSRDEAPATNGLAHFYEHMAFKGTPRFGPLDIVRRFEATGGQVNAWTSKEQTCFHGKVVDSEAEGALDVLLDMVFSGKFAPEDVRKEKDVVVEEIRSVNESPDELAHELFTRAAFGTHALGHPISGTEKTVRGLDAALLHRHRDAARTRIPAAVTAAGRVDHDAFVARVRRYFRLGRTGARGNVPLPPPRAPLARAAAAFRPRHLVKTRDVQQATVVIGGEGCARSSRDRFPMLLLHCVLGEGMSSRLFQNLRETHGLVYGIFSNLELFVREGLFSVGFATDPAQVERAVREIGREFARLRAEGLPARELQQAKDNLKGGILLELESPGSRMAALARRLLGGSWEETSGRVLARIDAVTRADILRCARQYLRPGAWASGAVMPKGVGRGALGEILGSEP